MQVWKKVLSMLLALALLLSCCPAITLTASAADATSFSYDFATFSGSSTQYAKESHDLGSGITLDLVNCHINSQLRIYSSNTNNGTAIFKSQNVITSITMNVGNKADKLNVYGSTDGSTWDLIEAVTTATSYANKTVALPEASAYHQIKLDVAGTQQVRIKTVAMTLVAGGATEPEETEPVVTEPEETTAPTEAPTEPNAPAGLLAEFTFGANGTASHVDGSGMSANTATYTSGGYTLTFTGYSSVYTGSKDAMGNSAIKFGTSSKTGTLTFTVADDVDYIVLRVAKYKTNTTKCSVNGTTHTLTKNSNNGEYDEITVDTTATKTITVATVSGGQRMMMDSISFFSNGGVAPEPPVTEPTEPADPDGTVLSIPQATAMGSAMASGESTVTQYAVKGTITGVSNTTYGNMYIEDADGNSILIYGLYSEDGTVRYDAMEVKPIEGDTITVWAVIGNYNGTPQLQNAQLKELIVGEHVQEPEDGTVLTIPEALEMGAAKADNTYTTNKFKVTGEITEVYNTTYGNMYIKDATGNILTIYGTYSADGETRYDKLEVKPEAGDTVTVYGVIGQFNGTPQMKNGWIVEHKAMPTATVVLTPSKTEVKRGESFDVIVAVTQAESYKSMGFDLSMTESPFTVTDAAVLEGVVGAQMQDCDTIHGGAFSLSTAQALTGNMFRFTLTVNEDAPFGAAVFTGTASANNDTQPLKVTLTNATVTIVCDHETVENMQFVDADTHQGTCAACGETVTASHSYGQFVEISQAVHGKTCAGCGNLQTETHNFVEGSCDVCGCMEEYTITFVNWDGTVLSEQTCYIYDSPEAPADPEKPADETYTYVFTGWDQEIAEVTGDAVYTAVFEPVYIEYTVTFLDHDGTVLQTGTYHYGDTVTAPAAPADWHDSEKTYTFSGWDAEIAAVAGNAEYTALYEVGGLRGDFNGDGKLSDRDAIYLLRATLGQPGYELNQSGDVNGDGETTDADVAYMLRFILFPHRYPLH